MIPDTSFRAGPSLVMRFGADRSSPSSATVEQYRPVAPRRNWLHHATIHAPKLEAGRRKAVRPISPAWTPISVQQWLVCADVW